MTRQIEGYLYRSTLLVSTLIVAMLIFGAGCADDVLSPTTDAPGDAQTHKQFDSKAHPSVLTPAGVLHPADVNSKHAPENGHGSDGDGFATPLFGLATAPNGDILVADAGAGIALRTGETDISLPGVTDMSPLGRGSMWALEGLTGSPGEDTGQALYRVSQGHNRAIADLFDYENKYNPDGGAVDSNPFDVDGESGRSAIVSDAGANDLLRVNNQGHIDLLAVFPNELVSTDNAKGVLGCPESEIPPCDLPSMIPAQPVPTSVAIGPDGYFYVGELKGFPAPLGESNIWKVAPDATGDTCPNAKCEKVFDGGFTSIIDLQFDEDGTLYVVELEENSWLALEVTPPQIAGGTINACDLDAGTCSEMATGIPIMTGVTFGKDGTLWATRNALIPGAADVFSPLP